MISRSCFVITGPDQIIRMSSQKSALPDLVYRMTMDVGSYVRVYSVFRDIYIYSID